MSTIIPPAGPLRRLASGALTTSIGNGAWYTSWALFLTDSVGLSPAQVGLGMTMAGALGLVLAVPAGHLADRLGPRDVFAALLAIQAAGALAYLAVGGLALFIVVACATVAASRASGGARNALVVGLAGERDRLQALSSLRSLNHVGWAAGAAVGALVIGLGSRSAYVAMIVLDAATFLAYAAAVMSVPRVPPMPRRQDGPALVVLRDGPYVTLAVPRVAAASARRPCCSRRAHCTWPASCCSSLRRGDSPSR